MTLATSASAPGKLFLFGEYSVLAAGLSIVCAVGRRVHATMDPSPSRYRVHGAPLSSHIALPQAVIAQVGGKPGDVARVHMDVSALYDPSKVTSTALGPLRPQASRLPQRCEVAPTLGPALTWRLRPTASSSKAAVAGPMSQAQAGAALLATASTSPRPLSPPLTQALCHRPPSAPLTLRSGPSRCPQRSGSRRSGPVPPPPRPP